MVGVATDPKRSANASIEKGECPTTYALCFDESGGSPGGRVNIFKKNNDGELKASSIFDQYERWRVASATSGRPFEKTNFVDWVKMYCKTES